MTDLKHPGCPAPVSSRRFKCPSNKVPLQELSGLLEGKAIGRDNLRYLYLSHTPKLIRQAFHAELVSFADDNASLDHILQFPDVSWPGVLHESLYGCRAAADISSGEAFRIFCKKMVNQKRNILWTFT